MTHVSVAKCSFAIYFQLVSSHCIILCHSVTFDLCVFSFRETENFYVSATEGLKQREKNETKLKKSVTSVDEKITEK